MGHTARGESCRLAHQAQCGTRTAEDPLRDVAASLITEEHWEQLRQEDAGSGKFLGTMLLL